MSNLEYKMSVKITTYQELFNGGGDRWTVSSKTIPDIAVHNEVIWDLRI